MSDLREEILGDDEDEEALIARLEAEERARLEEEDAMENLPQPLQPTVGAVPRGSSSGDGLNSLFNRLPISGCSGNNGAQLAIVARRFALLGCVSFGGAPAQMALIRSQFSDVTDTATFASLAALVQCVPGFSPAQLVASLGLLMAGGPTGGFVAVACFAAAGTLGVAVLGALPQFDGTFTHSLTLGLNAAAVALIAKSALQLGTTLAKEPSSKTLLVLSAALTVVRPYAEWMPPCVLIGGGLASFLEGVWKRRQAARGESSAEEKAEVLQSEERREAIREGRDPDQISTIPVPLTKRAAVLLGATWLGVWLLLLLLIAMLGSDAWMTKLVEFNYRCGSLVWYGGTPLVPLLMRGLGTTLTSPTDYLTGVAYVHALPGAGTFNLGPYTGAAYAGPLGALLSAIAIHTPGILLIYAALPFWETLRTSERVQDALKGINAASAGLVLTAAIRLFQSANTPPQHAILLLTFASLHLGWPATRLNVPAKYNPLVTSLVGLILGLVIGLPWLLTVVPSAPSSAAGSPPPPPFPFPPDPSPPPPPLPSPPEG